MTEWICPPLHSPSSWKISWCAHHSFAKCFLHSCLSALDRKLRVERPLYSENNMSIGKGIKKSRFNGLKKIAGHMRPPFGSASLERWVTAPMPQLCYSLASGGCFSSRFPKGEKRTVSDKTVALCFALSDTSQDRYTIHLPKSPVVFKIVTTTKSHSTQG